MRTLQHQTALIICAEGELALAVAERYAALGAHIILHTEYHEPLLQQAVSNIKAMGVKVTSITGSPDDENLNLLFGQPGETPKKIGIIVINHSHLNINVLQLLQQATQNVANGGRIIYLSSENAAPDLDGVLDFIYAAAPAFAPRGITINAILSPPNGSPLFERHTEASDVADAAEFFASDLANLITGQYLIVNGTKITA